MKENLYLLYCQYGISEKDNCSEIIYKAARNAFRQFCRRISFPNSVRSEVRFFLENQVEKFLSERIPILLDSVSRGEQGQELFDKEHHSTCQAIIQIYNSAGGVSYSIAQRWLNLTLMNLIAIEKNLNSGYLPIETMRKYFHIPVEQYLLEVATRKYRERFQNGLGLKCAPLKHSASSSYQFDWYSAGRTQPFEYWGYEEYMVFQKAVRVKLEEYIPNRYEDYIDWAFYAFLEQHRY